MTPVRPRAVRPAPAPPDVAHGQFTRGTRYPRAIAWFGFRSFWGHLWSLLASVIATEDIDSRDWMKADDPDDLTRRITVELGGVPVGSTLTESLGRDVWIDFVADTGDDVSVSGAVAEMIFAEYEVDDPAEPSKSSTLPRGDVLLFGGDTAYPVATDVEIHNRVIVPFNQALREVTDDRPRVLLGIPGNHDWYAGLDGFGRMFRAPLGAVDRASVVLRREAEEAPSKPDTEIGATQLQHFFEWVEAFRVGKRVFKRSALPIRGYTPVQSASYWALKVAPDLDLWGPDRQLYDVDDRQRMYFARERDEAEPQGVVLCMADPPYAFLEPYPPGMRILDALDLDLERDRVLALTGDIHHYCRIPFGDGMQVTAGGGGAFLQPARIERSGMVAPTAEFPGPKASLSLALTAPLQVAKGRAGLLVHTALALAYLPMYAASRGFAGPSPLGLSITGAALAVVLALVGGVRGKRALAVVGLAVLGGAALTFVPFALATASNLLGAHFGSGGRVAEIATFALSVLVGSFVVGVYFMALTILGVAVDQGFGPLAHPGYKHFVRLRFRHDGSGVDAWALGKVDPLDKDSPVVLIDRFFWRNPAHERR